MNNHEGFYYHVCHEQSWRIVCHEQSWRIAPSKSIMNNHEGFWYADLSWTIMIDSDPHSCLFVMNNHDILRPPISIMNNHERYPLERGLFPPIFCRLEGVCFRRFLQIRRGLFPPIFLVKWPFYSSKFPFVQTRFEREVTTPPLYTVTATHYRFLSKANRPISYELSFLWPTHGGWGLVYKGYTLFGPLSVDSLTIV
mgnify:CR=1 FL=1